MESVSRLSSMLETARDLTIEAAQSAGASRGYGPRSAPRELPFAQVKKLLESRFEREVLDGLRRVITMMYQSKPSLPYFSIVVKNVASPNVEIRKLVYIYILHHAESEPDLALLSINTIQKSLSDQTPQVRAMALRVMSGIRVPVISQIVSLAIKKGCGDMSPHVRKAAALAIPKCYKLDPSTLPQLVDYLTILLGDKQYFVVGPAVMAFLEVCPERIDLIHKHYRSLIRKLIDMDEWGQLALTNLMTSYARKCFPRRIQDKKGKGKATSDSGQKETKVGNLDGTTEELDPDLALLLRSCKPLLNSHNAAVVIAVARCFIHLGTKEYVDATAGPLIALLRSPHDLHEVVFNNILGVCIIRPTPFVPYFSHFLVQAADSEEVARLKLELMALLFPHSDENTRGLILSELEHFTLSTDGMLVRESVRAIGACARSDSKTSRSCLNLLLKHVTSSDDVLVAEALTVIRHLIQQNPSAHQYTIIRLAKNLDSMINTHARASIIWLVGEFAPDREEDDIAPDVLRILVQSFADEDEPAKLQILNLAAKVFLRYLNRTASESGEGADEDEQKNRADTTNAVGTNATEENSTAPTGPRSSISDHPIVKLWDYVLLLVRYDTSYDLRDRMRLYRALLDDPTSIQLANLIILAPKPAPHVPSPSERQQNFLLGSTSMMVGSIAGSSGLSGYEPLPDWVRKGDEPDPALRDDASETLDRKANPAIESIDSTFRSGGGQSSLATSGLNKNKTLDDWLDEEEEEEEAEEVEVEVEVEVEEEEEGSDEYEEVSDDEEEEYETESEEDVEAVEGNASQSGVHDEQSGQSERLLK